MALKSDAEHPFEMATLEIYCKLTPVRLLSQPINKGSDRPVKNTAAASIVLDNGPCVTPRLNSPPQLAEASQQRLDLPTIGE